MTESAQMLFVFLETKQFAAYSDIAEFARDFDFDADSALSELCNQGSAIRTAHGARFLKKKCGCACLEAAICKN